MSRPSPQAEPDPADVPASETLFEPHLPLIERLLASIARRKHLSPDDAEEFASWTRLKLLEDDCARLRKHGGKASFAGFLKVVVHNLYRDWRNEQWGKWRPSAAARRLGVVAVRLETLVYRDGFGYEEAVRKLRTHHGVTHPEEELVEIFARLRAHTSRRIEGEDQLGSLPVEGGTEERLEDAERREISERVEEVYHRALGDLDPETRLVFRMRFESGFKVVTIARRLGLAQKPLYRRIERCLARLRRTFEEEGIGPEEIRRLFGWKKLDLRFGPPDDKSTDFDEPEGESTHVDPSQEEERGPE